MSGDPSNAIGTTSSKKRRAGTLGRVLRFVVYGVLAMFVLLGVVYTVLCQLAEHVAARAVAETDKLAPEGWRLDQVEQGRVRVPDDRNAALLVRECLERLPKIYEIFDGKRRTASGLPRDPDLWETLSALPANVRATTESVGEIRAELALIGEALIPAHALADRTHGGFPISYAVNPIETLLHSTDETRKVARLLKLDAICRAEDGDIDGALEDCRAILGAGAAIGDEPALFSQLVRIAIVSMALEQLERTLAQGEASDRALASLQERLYEESKNPWILIGIRGERAIFFDATEKLAQGSLPDSAAPGRPKVTRIGRVGVLPHVRAFYLSNQATGLGFHNRAVAIASMPIERQAPHWDTWSADVERLQAEPLASRHSSAYLHLRAIGTAHLAEKRVKGQLGVAQVLIAMERFRLVSGRWPESLVEIPRSLLPVHPIDPFDAKPVKLARLEAGWAVYCIGPDGVDDQGKLGTRYGSDATGMDWGLRVWDPSARRKEPPTAEVDSEGS